MTGRSYLSERPSDACLVFLHIPKTGGTSLHNILQAEFAEEDCCPERFNHLQKWNAEDLARFRFFSGHFDRGSLELIPRPKRVITMFRDPQARILSLYNYWRSHKWEVIESADLDGPRLAKSLGLLEFLRYNTQGIPSNIDNVLTRTLLGEIFVDPKRNYLFPKEEVFPRVKDYIDSLDTFGIMESYDESVRLILDHLQIPMPDKIPHARDSRNHIEDPSLEPVVREEITPEIAAELDRLTDMDRRVYDYAQQRFAALVAARNCA